MESFTFDNEPSQVGGSDYGNQHEKDPGAEIIQAPGFLRLLMARTIDYFLPWLVFSYFLDGYLQDAIPIALLVNSVWLQGTTGASIGKRAMGLKLIYVPDIKEKQWSFLLPGVGRCFLRMLAHTLDVIFMLGFIKGLLHPYGQTFADNLASTVVIEDDGSELMTMQDYRRAIQRGY